jgi:hypothetical protein
MNFEEDILPELNPLLRISYIILKFTESKKITKVSKISCLEMLSVVENLDPSICGEHVCLQDLEGTVEEKVNRNEIPEASFFDNLTEFSKLRDSDNILEKMRES